MDFKEQAESARSCRRFNEEQPLSRNDLAWLIECARLAPSGRNAQVLRFITTGRIMTEQLFPLTRWAGALKDWGGPHPGERPTAFIAVLMPENAGELVHFDVGIAAQTIQLAASSKGWGCCMIASFTRNDAASLLRVPQGMSIALLLGLGVAAETRVVAAMPADGSFSYYRDEAGVHYVPKRSITDLVQAHFD